MSPYIVDYPRYVRQLLNGFRINREQVFAIMRQQDIAPYLEGACFLILARKEP